MRKRFQLISLAAILTLGTVGYFTLSAISDPTPVEKSQPAALAKGLSCAPQTPIIVSIAEISSDPVSGKATPEAALAEFLAAKYPKANISLFPKVGHDLDAAIFENPEARFKAEIVNEKWHVSEWAICQTSAASWGKP